MAATASPCAQPTMETPVINGAKPMSVKELVESSALNTIPSSYSFSTQLNESSAASEPDESLPTIDFALLTSADPHQRSKVIRDLEIACREWGFFMLVNHGVPERVMKAALDGCHRFFEMELEEKLEFAGRDVWKPIRFGTGVDVKVEKFHLWRDFFKAFVHPEFNFPNKPQGFNEAGREYSTRCRKVVSELLKGISETLGFEQDYIDKAMNVESSGFQVFAANLYPSCPQPELAMGIPAHADHGLLTLLIQNGVGGLQIQHKGKWFNVDPLPNSILVNTADQLEILSNGKYKSVMHRAVVNNHTTRISIAIPHGPSLDTVVAPSKELVERENSSPAFMPMTYKEYIEFQQKIANPGKSCVEQLRILNTA